MRNNVLRLLILAISMASALAIAQPAIPTAAHHEETWQQSPTGCQTVNCQQNRPSGIGKKGWFHQGEAVAGYLIQEHCCSPMTLCYLPYARSDGWVLDGAVNPTWAQVNSEEIKGKRC